jgi:hypothetical protein
MTNETWVKSYPDVQLSSPNHLLALLNRLDVCKDVCNTFVIITLIILKGTIGFKILPLIPYGMVKTLRSYMIACTYNWRMRTTSKNWIQQMIHLWMHPLLCPGLNALSLQLLKRLFYHADMNKTAWCQTCIIAPLLRAQPRQAYQ